MKGIIENNVEVFNTLPSKKLILLKQFSWFQLNITKVSTKRKTA